MLIKLKKNVSHTGEYFEFYILNFHHRVHAILIQEKSLKTAGTDIEIQIYPTVP